MAAKSPTFAYNLLKLLFNGTTFSGLGENDSVSPLTQLWVSLHVANPINSDNQTSSEANYVGYARQPVNRTAAALPVTAGTPPSVALAADIDFPAIGAGSSAQTYTYFGIGTAQTGAGELLYSGPISPTIPVQAGQSGPVLTAGSYVREQ